MKRWKLIGVGDKIFLKSVERQLEPYLGEIRSLAMHIDLSSLLALQLLEHSID